MRYDHILDEFEPDEGHEIPAWAEEGEVVAKFFAPLEAELAAARLRSEGIHCFLANTGIQSVMPHLQTVIRLHVRPLDSAKAREILQEAAIEASIPGKSSSSGSDASYFLVAVISVILIFLLMKARYL